MNKALVSNNLAVRYVQSYQYAYLQSHAVYLAGILSIGEVN